MKAASSEWYNTTARHVLPVPTSSLSSTSNSRTSQGQRLLHGSTSSSYASRYLSSSYDPSTSLSSQRSLSIRSTGSGLNNSSSIPSTKRKPYSFSKSRSSQSTSSTTGATFSSSTDPTTSTTTTSGLRQTPSTSSVSRSDDLSSYKYKRSTPLYPLGISSSSYLTSSFPRISETEAETDVAFTEGEEEDFRGTGASLPTDEASTTEEEEDEDDVYKSFTDSLRMLRVPHHPNPRSLSPALSFQSVLTELEEDEEDLPPDQVEDEMQTTTEEEEEEEGGESSAKSTSYFSSSVPKSPVKVRVKVEKASSSDDHDDGRVKVTVQLEPEETEVSEEEEETESEEEEEDDDSDATENTAETVRYRHRRSTHESRTDEDESDDYGNEESESGGESESDLLSEVPEPERTQARAHVGKTDSRILIPPSMLGSPYRHIVSLGDMPSRVPSGSHHRFPPGRSRTIHEIQSKTFSESKKSDSSKINNTTSVAGGPPPAANNTSSSHSETSSRSQSARTSAVGRGNRMYSLGGKLRSLSARKTVIGSSSFLRQLRPPPSPIPSQSLSVTSYNNAKTFSLKDSTSSSSNSDPSRNLPDTSSSTHYILSKFASLAPPPKPSTVLSLPKLRSLSASRAASKLELEQLRQLSLGNNITTLPPITPSSLSQSSSTSSSLSKPRPFVRNDTYTVLNPSTYDPGHLPGPHSPPEYVNPCVAEHLAMHQIMSQDLSEEASSTPAKSGPVPLPYDSLMTTALSFRRDQSNRDLSFATYVLENSMCMSSYQSQTTTRQSTSSQLTGSGSASTNGDDENEEDNEDEVRADMERVLKEDRLINKNVITLDDLEQEVVDGEPPQVKHDKLKKFALATIRKQMVLERKRQETIQRLSDGESDEDDDEEDDEDGSSEEDSDEDNPESSSKKQADGTHIPMPVGPDTLGEAGTDRDPSSRSGPPGTQSKSSGGAKLPGQNSDDSLHITQPAEVEWNWKDDLQKNFDNEDPSIRTPIPSRPESAESGYRALPPSRASTVAPSRQHSTDSMEQEKDRLLSEWRKAGGVGAPPSVPKSTKSASRRGSGSGVTGTGQDGSESLHLPELIHGDIDLNKELPDEKKLNLVWEEFTKDDREAGATADYDFSSLIDEMVTDVNNYKLRLSSTSGINLNGSPSQSQSLQVSSKKSAKSYEVPKFDESRKYQTLSEMVSLLSHNLRLISAETMEDHMASLISLISNILKKVRKNKTEDDYVTQIACLSAIRVLCDRLLEMHNSQNLKYADLSWLFRILCKYSSDSDSKIRPESSFCLARLVKVAGPALVVRPIYFILVMESEGGTGKTTTGAKTKAAAIDTLTYALLTFPKEDFHNLEEIAGWVCLAMLNEERRIRQSALECLAIISKHITREKALPLFHTLFLKEELDHFSRSPSPESNKTGKTGKSHKGGKGSDPIPLSVHGTVRLLTGPGFPIAQPIDAITARLDKDILPVPSTKGLIEYAVNVPTGKDLVLLMTHMLDKDDDEWDFSSSTDSMDSGSASVQSKRSSVSSLGFSDIDWTGQGQKNEKKGDPDELITADVAYILLGKGRVNKQEVVLLDTYKKEIIPEIIEMLRNSKGKQRKNRKRYGKQKGRSRRRRGQRSNNNAEPRILDKERRPPIPTLSFDCDDDDNEGEGGYYRGSGGSEDEAYDDQNSPVAVVVDPPLDEETEPSQGTETATQSTSK